jgi:superfamily II DNA or RNA helicase
MMTESYGNFVEGKRVEVLPVGFDAPELSAQLFDFQRETVLWALRKGRAAIFFDCGLGKTFMQLEWARCVAEKTGKPVLVLAPLAVGYQTQAEGGRFGIPVSIAKDQTGIGDRGIYVTNYERLQKFDAGVFGGVVLDESSILKSYMGKTKRNLLTAFKNTPFRLCCTATPAPNDHLELGNHCEFLGVMTSHEMIARWFINDLSLFGTYRLKGHARVAFWDWVSSWARAAESPADLGYEASAFVLPPLDTCPINVTVDLTADRADGQLFRMPEMSATSIHREKRRTADARALAIAEKVRAEPDEPWLIWVDTNYEADALSAVLPEVVEVAGKDSIATKEKRLLGFTRGEVQWLMTKPKIAGFGLNWQHCARVAFMGPTFSYEGFYQAVRRVWRFGQLRPVKVFIAMATTESHIYHVMTRKADAHVEMKREMHAAMRRAHSKESPKMGYEPHHKARIPSWFRTT